VDLLEENRVSCQRLTLRFWRQDEEIGDRTLKRRQFWVAG
jgi:hypothetical protein